jgi:glutathionylspermidine synthase
VPGGIAEASVLPAIVNKYFTGYVPGASTASAVLEAFKDLIKPGGTVAFIHATAYADDRQVMQCMGDTFERKGYRAIYAAPDAIQWDKIKDIDGIVRFFPAEWFENLPRKSKWKNFFTNETPACNHPSAILTQSKRLPLVWDTLNVNIPAWKELLPQTADPRFMDKNGEWILKPAFGRVGEGISIKETTSEKNLRRIEKAAKKYPVNWVRQRMFNSRPLTAEDGKTYHLCIGVFTVQGKAAGFYGRVNTYAHINADAKDIPVLVKHETP